MVDNQEMTFLGALMHAFKKPGQTTADFAQEVKALTDEDKAYFRAELIKAGYKLRAV